MVHEGKNDHAVILFSEVKSLTHPFYFNLTYLVHRIAKPFQIDEMETRVNIMQWCRIKTNWQELSYWSTAEFAVLGYVSVWYVSVCGDMIMSVLCLVMRLYLSQVFMLISSWTIRLPETFWDLMNFTKAPPKQQHDWSMKDLVVDIFNELLMSCGPERGVETEFQGELLTVKCVCFTLPYTVHHPAEVSVTVIMSEELRGAWIREREAEMSLLCLRHCTYHSTRV